MYYFDHSATSYPKPACVKQAVYESMDLYGNAGRGSYPLSIAAARLLYQTRETCLRFFHAPKGSYAVLTHGATQSLNIVINGLFKQGDHVITTQSEHNAVLRPSYDVVSNGVRISYLPVDEQGVVQIDRLESMIEKHTKALLCCHASNVTGNVIDLKEVHHICQKHGILLIVDAAQSAGHYPINMEEDGIDILCFSGHKGLYGPTGSGGIILRKDDGITPLLHGGSGFDSYAKTQPEHLPERLEAGTMPIPAIAGMKAGIEYVEALGVAAIHKKEMALSRQFYEGIRELPGIRIVGDMTTPQRCALVSFSLDGIPSATLCDILANDYDIAVRGGAHCAPLLHQALGSERYGLTRFSFGYHTTSEEVDTAIKALWEIVE